MTSKNDTQKRVFLQTFGCQMNLYDTEVATGILEANGFKVINSDDVQAGSLLRALRLPLGEVCDEATSDSAEVPRLPKLPRIDGKVDVILFNTCSVRKSAEERVVSRLGKFGKIKKQNPELILGLMGCMVEEHREKLFERFPYLDFIIGTRNIKELPDAIESVRKSRERISRIKENGISIEYTDLMKRESKHHAWLPIMTGCDKKCTYCIVPITRGHETSMTTNEIYREARRLADDGVTHITLLGQNVNSYRGGEAPETRHQSPTVDGGNRKPTGRPTTPPTFPELLETLCKIEGLKQISFTTSHPHDATEALFQAIKRNPKISRHFHLPLQSGSDFILKRMGRLHTYAEFKAQVERLRELVEDISITTDIIVGFSGERPEDFEATKRAFEEIRFDGAFIFKYSPREGTPAWKLADDVPVSEKEKRNQELLKIQRRISRENNLKLVGKTFRVYVDGVSAKNRAELVGRTIHNKRVVFPGDVALAGSFQNILLKELRHETFSGKRV
jgi:tRNA-2-methylthio-N6-dimethylallyladenosine synthase